MTSPPLDDARDLLARFDAFTLEQRTDVAGQRLLQEIETRAVVSIAESLHALMHEVKDRL